LGSRWLEQTFAYRIWMAPFAEAKFAPILAHNDLQSVTRVLDVGCGPGTNTHHFSHASYLGLDINDRYVADARARYMRDFRAVDVTEYTAEDVEPYDFILLNSFLHHIDTKNVRRILNHLTSLLADDGHIHILDLVLPDERSVARQLARWDRGDHPRPLGQWQNLFEESFDPVVFEPYPITAAGVTLWNMVYFKGSFRKGVPDRADLANDHASST
jgi:SAM-dependent methyltransferase